MALSYAKQTTFSAFLLQDILGYASHLVERKNIKITERTGFAMGNVSGLRSKAQSDISNHGDHVATTALAEPKPT